MNAGTHDDQHAHKARLLRRAKRAVVKIGSNVLAGTSGLRRERVRALAGEIAALAAAGRQIVVVSSGAVAAGAVRLAGSGRSRSRIEWRQAAAAVGQIGLMAAYERAFAAHDRHVAQVLLTHATRCAPSSTSASCRSSTRTTRWRSRSWRSATTTTSRR